MYFLAFACLLLAATAGQAESQGRDVALEPAVRVPVADRRQQDEHGTATGQTETASRVWSKNPFDGTPPNDSEDVRVAVTQVHCAGLCVPLHRRRRIGQKCFREEINTPARKGIIALQRTRADDGSAERQRGVTGVLQPPQFPERQR